ncbi:signal peptidase II [Corynebacterium sp. A21]|uniref:signal peptidase II n=1 Tax=Corynebacterium sp. A21 TaxID=3457318 RepID=UPI003FD2E819
MMALVVIITAIIDQITKTIMLNWLEPGEPVGVIGDWFRFYLLFNPGAAFSMGAGSTWLFTCIQIVFILGVAIYSPRVTDRWVGFGLALIAGGAAGNLLDRLFREPQFFLGHVVDFISVGNFAVFNIADSAITVGVIVFVIAMFSEEIRESRKERAEHETAAVETTEGGIR